MTNIPNESPDLEQKIERLKKYAPALLLQRQPILLVGYKLIETTYHENGDVSLRFAEPPTEGEG